jgi:beta-galactosidase
LKRTPILTALMAMLAFTALEAARANDGIFPPVPAAASSINFDGEGFLINGVRTFIASGGMEYARVPRALWRDRLLRMKRAGFNCTEMYIFWNYHEPKENQWNFSGDHDLDAYLKLIHELGMYAIVRVGPYDCAEWDSGGWPVWLRFKPGIIVRADNQPFLNEAFKYYDKVIPIIAANQINHGGSVILVQVENEDPDGWGTDSTVYEQKMRARVLADGIQVPTFFSGLHHGFDPAGRTAWDDATRTNPWFTTEFWTGWFTDYGAMNPDTVIRNTWKIIAFGGSGFNYYMEHGGTNFDFYNNNEDASSYDYSAGIGQAGDLRPLYYKQKEAVEFAETFSSILESSVNSTASFTGVTTNPALKVYARTSPAGTIIFLDNPTGNDITTQVAGGRAAIEPASGPAIVPERKMLPIVENFAVTPAISIDQSVTQILTAVTNGNDTTLVVYGQPGSFGSIELSSKSTLSVTTGHGWTQYDPTHGALQIAYPNSGVQSTVITSGTDNLQILSLGEDLAERTWSVPTNGGTELVVGPDYVGESTTKNSNKTFDSEYTSSTPGTAFDFSPDFKQTTLLINSATVSLPPAPTLTDWTEHQTTESAENFDDSHWLSGVDPPFMGADGDISAYAWYRTVLNTPSASTQYFVPANVGDRMVVFVDGSRLPKSQVTAHDATLMLTAGAHTLSILTAHYGRNKLYAYSGPINTIDAKGLVGPIVFSSIPKLSLTTWQNLPVVTTHPDETTAPSPTDPGWAPVSLGADVFNNTAGWDWYQTVVPTSDVAAQFTKVTLHFDSVDDNATVYNNGKLVGSHQGFDTGFDLDLTSSWLGGQQNVITVLDQNTNNGGGIFGHITLLQEPVGGVITGWKMRGGVGDPTRLKNWVPLAPSSGPAPPAFYKAQFVGAPPGAPGPYPILRVHLGGMSGGFVWLNGHNLGRYPEKVPVDGLYLPENWINKGNNTLIIFDEDGQLPTNVSLYNELAASRYEFTLST